MEEKTRKDKEQEKPAHAGSTEYILTDARKFRNNIQFIKNEKCRKRHFVLT